MTVKANPVIDRAIEGFQPISAVYRLGCTRVGVRAWSNVFKFIVLDLFQQH